jgi:hypothetical protein
VKSAITYSPAALVDAMSELLDYDKSVVETLKHIEDILVKFSLQNYASAGAVFLAHYNTDKLSLEITVLLVFVLGVVFLSAIASNVHRYRLLHGLHRIVRGQWLKQDAQRDLQNALSQDPALEKYLTNPFSPWFFLPVFVINALPALSALLVAIMSYYRPGTVS